MRAANSFLPEATVLPLSSSKNTPGLLCICETTTRSVPLTINVPLSVISGISPINTSCSLMSCTDFAPVASSTSNTTRRSVAFTGAAYVRSRFMHSSTSYFGCDSSYLTNSSTPLPEKSRMGKMDLNTSSRPNSQWLPYMSTLLIKLLYEPV